MPTQSTNPAFSNFASQLRAAACNLAEARRIALVELRRPEFDFDFVCRHLESMARCAEEEKILLAYRKHNALTRAPNHAKNAIRVRGGRARSERKRAAAKRNGALGGRSKSFLKQEAARLNGKRGGRPPLGRDRSAQLRGGLISK